MPISRDPPLTNREYAYISISGVGSNEAITTALGLSPSNAWNVGDVDPRNGKPRTHMRWELHSGLDDTHPLREHIDELLLMLGGKALAVRALWVEYNLTLACVGYFLATGHGAHLDREVVRQAAGLGLAFDLDFYFLEDMDAPGRCLKE